MQQRARDLLAGRLVVVTGASAGIGRAFVESVASPGTRFVLVARRRPELESLAEAVWARGGEALVQAVDLRDPDAARSAAVDSLVAMGVPDLVVANAGHSIARGVLATVERPDSVLRNAAVNYTGAVAHALPLLGVMAERGSGHLIGSSTANARLTVPGWGPYAASKAAWDAWLRAAAPELARHGLATSIVAFPLVDTAMAAPTRGRRRALSPEQAAGWVARAVVTRQARVAPSWLKLAEVAHAAAPTVAARLTGRFSLRLAQR